MIAQRLRNFKLGTLHQTQATGSAGMALVLSLAQNLGLEKELERRFSHLKQRRRGYEVSALLLSFIRLIIQGGDRLNDLEMLESDPGLLTLTRMPRIPRPNTMAEVAKKFSRKDIHRLAEVAMELGVRALRIRKPKRLILDIDSTLMKSDKQMATRTYEGYRGFNPLLAMLRGGGLNLSAFSLFRLGHESPQSHNVSLSRKNIRFLRIHLPGVPILLRSDSAGYNHRLMRLCDREGVEYVIGGRETEAIPPLIRSIRHWERLRGSRREEEVGETVHFIGTEKEGAACRLVVVRRKKEQRSLFPEDEYTYRCYITNALWHRSTIVRFYRKRGDAENVIKELKEGFGLDHILSEEFLSAAVFFQLQILAYTLVQVFKVVTLDSSWRTLRIKQLRFRLINVAGMVTCHARMVVLRLSVRYCHFDAFRRVYYQLNVRLVELHL
jgi:hypothetical protein